jgi:hypothetical protein
VIPVTLVIVLFGAVLLAGAAIGVLAAVVIHGRGCAGYGRLAHVRRSYSLVRSETILTAEVSSPAFQGPARAPAQLRLPQAGGSR